jgi:hypothetical protein
MRLVNKQEQIECWRKEQLQQAREPEHSKREYGEYREGLGDEQEKERGWFASQIESKRIL